MRSHPKTCKCSTCIKRLEPTKRGGRHPHLCQCAGCVTNRLQEWNVEARQKRLDSLRAIEALKKGDIPRSRPVFVRAHFRKQRHFLGHDPALRSALLNDEPTE